MTPLETPRLRLRGPAFGDAVRIAELLNNEAVAGNLTDVPYPYALADAQNWLGTWRADAAPAATYFIIDIKGEGAAGVIGFSTKPEGASLGYWLGEPYWGKGLMSGATRRVITWYFASTDAEEIVSGVFHFNMASLAIQQKLGFVETGRSTRFCRARNQEIEHIDTELTRDAFAAGVEVRQAWA
jgi:RimJ/RimL family protein N-acetyltransferase